jgi:hypothetical protein
MRFPKIPIPMGPDQSLQKIWRPARAVESSSAPLFGAKRIVRIVACISNVADAENSEMSNQVQGLTRKILAFSRRLFWANAWFVSLHAA